MINRAGTTGKLTQALLHELRRTGCAERAMKQQAYMKSELPFAGVAAPELKAVQKEIFAAHPLPDKTVWQREVLSMFCDAPVRELRYAALGLAFYKAYRPWLSSDVWDMLDTLVVTGAWWDLIDTLAPNHFAHLLKTEPEIIKPRIQSYASDSNIWRRRVAILCQLKARDATDEDLLFGSITKSLGHKEFFIRKAIGWALRSHSRINPDGVLDYVRKNKAGLSPLSVREGLKLLGK